MGRWIDVFSPDRARFFENASEPRARDRGTRARDDDDDARIMVTKGSDGDDVDERAVKRARGGGDALDGVVD